MRRLIDDLEENLDAIRAETLASLTMRRQNETLLREVRSLHSDFVEEAEPLVDDARVIVQGQLEELETRSARGCPAGGGNPPADPQGRGHPAAFLACQPRDRPHQPDRGGGQPRTADPRQPFPGRGDRSHPPAGAAAGRRRRIRSPCGRSCSGLSSFRPPRMAARASAAGTRAAAETRAAAAAKIGPWSGAFDGEIAGMVSRASCRRRERGAAPKRQSRWGATCCCLWALLRWWPHWRGDFLCALQPHPRIRHLADAARMLGDGAFPRPSRFPGRDELSDMARAMEGSAARRAISCNPRSWPHSVTSRRALPMN